MYSRDTGRGNSREGGGVACEEAEGEVVALRAELDGGAKPRVPKHRVAPPGPQALAFALRETPHVLHRGAPPVLRPTLAPARLAAPTDVALARGSLGAVRPLWAHVLARLLRHEGCVERREVLCVRTRLRHSDRCCVCNFARVALYDTRRWHARSVQVMVTRPGPAESEKRRAWELRRGHYAREERQKTCHGRAGARPARPDSSHARHRHARWAPPPARSRGFLSVKWRPGEKARKSFLAFRISMRPSFGNVPGRECFSAVNVMRRSALAAALRAASSPAVANVRNFSTTPVAKVRGSAPTRPNRRARRPGAPPQMAPVMIRPLQPCSQAPCSSDVAARGTPLNRCPLAGWRERPGVCPRRAHPLLPLGDRLRGLHGVRSPGPAARPTQRPGAAAARPAGAPCAGGDLKYRPRPPGRLAAGVAGGREGDAAC